MAEVPTLPGIRDRQDCDPKYRRWAAMSLLHSVSRRDPATARHCRKVADMAADLGRSMGLAARDVSLLWAAGLLHDVGKVAVPPHILGKSGPLSVAERRIVAEHAPRGEAMLQRLGALRDAAPIVRYHHQFFDGGGSAGGLRGADIPLLARVLAIVDAYDAMTSDRVYRKALPHLIARIELRRHAGRQFDPEIVPAFLRQLRDRQKP